MITPDAIEFGIGGNNKGFVAVLNDTEKKAKDSTTKVAKELDKVGEAGFKNKGKLLKDLNGIAGDFGKLTSAGGAFETLMGRVGSGLKMAGVVAGIAAIGKGMWDATASATELDLLMQRINRSSAGGVANFGMDKLKEDLERIKEARQANADGVKDWFSAYGTVIKNTLARMGNATLGRALDVEVDVKDPHEIEETLRKAQVVALDRILKKQKEIWDIESVRLKGNKEAAEIAKIQAEYQERIQAAIDEQTKTGLDSTGLQKQLHIERDAVIEAAMVTQDDAANRRTSAERFAALGARDAQNAVSMTTEDEQRQANKIREDQAISESYNASRAAAGRPEDKDLATAAYIAEQNIAKVKAENAKWERDLARSKGDTLKMTQAERSASEAELRGMPAKAALIRLEAKHRQEIVQAQRAGNVEQEKALRLAFETEKRQLAIRRIMDGDRVKSLSQVRSGERQEQVNARIAGRAADRLERAEDDPMRRVVARVGRSPRSSKSLGVISRDSTNAGREMEHRQDIAAIGMSKAQRDERLGKQQEERIKGGKAGPEEALAKIVQILDSWNQQ